MLKVRCTQLEAGVKMIRRGYCLRGAWDDRTVWPTEEAESVSVDREMCMFVVESDEC